MIRRMVLVPILFHFLCCPVTLFAQRPQITLETIVKNADVVFEGKVRQLEEIPAPTNDYVLIDSKKALRVDFDEVRPWKPKVVSENVSVYSRIISEAPCSGVEVLPNRRYIVFGHYDSKKQHVLADICIDILDAEAPARNETVLQLNKLLGPFPNK